MGDNLFKAGAIEGLEPAIYFSTVTYTTLGYGDMVLDEQWRLLASFEAAVGIIVWLVNGRGRCGCPTRLCSGYEGSTGYKALKK